MKDQLDISRYSENARQRNAEERLARTACSPNVKPMGEVTICRNGYIQELESERDRYKAWAKRFRDLLAPLAWLDGVDNPNDTEKAIIQFDEENASVEARQK